MPSATPQPLPLAEAVRFCDRLSRKTAGNFYFSFLTLPGPLRLDMSVLYAFMRRTDDIADGDEGESEGASDVSLAERRARLDDWQERTRAVLAGEADADPVLTATADLVTRRDLDPSWLDDVIEGMRLDLTGLSVETFADLERYCYHVAGAVGLCCVGVWGYSDPERTHPAACDCGTAFQLTNILRDLQEDAARGRCYLPQEDLDRFGYTLDDIVRGVVDERFRALMTFQTERARGYYDRSEVLFETVSAHGRSILKAMRGIYGGLLEKIAADPAAVYRSRVRLPKWKKLWIAVRSVMGK